MSMRQSATGCPGVQVPEKPRSRRPGDRARWQQEQEQEQEMRGKVIRTRDSSPAPVASERMFRSREAVEKWLESSPTSVLEDLDDESACSPSSFESFNSSPAGSIGDHLSCSTTRFQCPTSKTSQPPGHRKSRTISPPRCTANKNSVDLSRIDPAHYNNGSFLVLAFKNAQYRGSSTPVAFQYTPGGFAEDRVQSLNVEEFGSCRSEFSLTSEWQSMLAAGTAAGMSTRVSVGNNSGSEAPNISDLDLDSDVSNFPAKPQVVRRPVYHRTRSMDIPRMHDRSASGELKCSLVDNSKHTRASAKLERSLTDAGTIHEQVPLRRLSRRNSVSFSSSLREAFGSVEKRKVRSTPSVGEEAERAKLISRYEREKEIKSWEDYRREIAPSTAKQPELKRVHLMEKMQNDMATGRSKSDEKKATAEAKRSGKAARAVVKPKVVRRSSKVTLGCLFLL